MIAKKIRSTKVSDKESAKGSSLKYLRVETLKKISQIKLPTFNTLKQKARPITYCGIAFLIGFGTKTLLTSSSSVSEIAVVDVQKVVNTSPDVVLLRQKLQQRTQAIEKWLASVREDIKKQKTKEDKDKLTQKYNNEFAQKQQLIKKENAAEMKEIEIKIQKLISTIGKDEGFRIIFPKSSVLDGGTDITNRVIKAIK